ncbi:C-Jun-amino-terminal kinase-interacting protein 4-like isoform X1 [Coregonus clupeaformis]|uniref:C-Jun-amino-terminal kinase-interacting protein 4-like isoform X1 n=1 Tax=Coregonus clupeaformis TaxID=59861 RepID=UPI001BDFBED6|nr:C-Jun-amino-terminal kinase-interacting protein 4-like isoform X1 [Coregonus clupeaformis]
MELEDGVVYQDDPGTSAMMSERVSGLANSIYREFEKLIGKYDEDVVKELMPLVVAVLENLDSVFAENQEHEVELELLKEDNEQLITQYEREKALRKHAEEKFMEFEDSQEQEKKDLQNHVGRMESHSRQLELKIKNYADQIGRMEERESELKKEFNSLHQRHTEMIHNYMEHVERIKLHQMSVADTSDSGTLGRVRKERPMSLGVFPMSGGGSVLTPDLQARSETSGAEAWIFNNLEHPRSNASLKLDADDPPKKREGYSTLQITWGNSLTDDCKDELSDLGSKSVTPMSTTASDVAMEGEGPNSKSMEVLAAPGNRSISVVLPENEDSSEVQDIIESTPELDMDLSGYKASSTPTKGGIGIENMAFDRNTDSLFAELSSAGIGDVIGDVDEGADLLVEYSELSLLGMGREVENLITENTQLMETKNALNVVKNDLIARVDELSCEKEVLQGELDAVTQTRRNLEEKNRELEEELKKVRVEMEEVKGKTNEEEDSDVPTAQRKRFTRVEMARVLMERNQYKERLMELQEAVRWTEMIRASRENPSFTEKKKSSIWQFISFSRLFSASASSTAVMKKAESQGREVKYTPPAGGGMKKRSSTFSQFPIEKSKAFDFLNEEMDPCASPSRREQKKAQYRQVKAHMQKEDGQVQAHGWSLPSKSMVVNGDPTENKEKNLPVPVYLRPLDQKDASMKLWCAAGVNLSGGKIREGGSMLEGQNRKGSVSSLDQLETENKEQEKGDQEQEKDEMSSRVWICTSTHSSTKVMVLEANQPSDLLDSFYACNSHVLCIASIPGVLETDYPAGEELPVPQDQEAGPVDGVSLTGSVASLGSMGSDGAMATEGTTAVLQLANAGVNDLPAQHSSVDLSREPSPAEDGVPTAEEATEATEEGEESQGLDISQPGIYTEHVFTDPLGAGHHESSTADTQRDQEVEGEASLPDDMLPAGEDLQRMSSALPTMWLGAQNGCLYVHSSVARWRKCLHAIKLKDSILNIVHVRGRVLVALADGTLAIFHRGLDGQWDLTNYHLLDLGRPHHSIRCMTVVHDKVWCGYRNKIYVIQPKAMRIEKFFDAHPRKESQVRQLAWVGDGIWVSIRLDSTLRLFHAHTYQHLQDVDIEPYVSKMLGTGKLGFSFVRITALMISCSRLWVGTGNGVIISIPLSEAIGSPQHGVLLRGLRANKTAGAVPNRPGGAVRVYSEECTESTLPGSFVPYCSMAQAQLCFHGHRDAVKFFAAVPGQVIPPPGHGWDSGSDNPASESPDTATSEHAKTFLVISGGEGYIDFRMGDDVGEVDGSLSEPTMKQATPAKPERSHIIVWQVISCQE